ncbi:transposase [Nonomuraea diastatica]|uniref:Transposase n=1 Tax=Nonomuraea diastatica TaxID=1848329 RepID=A0A4V2YDM8_9ACTN|nr:transposase [Nonomuraea diastatica]
MAVVFPHLDSVLVERVEREGDALRVIARSRGEPMPCPSCGVATGKVHGYYRRRLADSPTGGTPVLLELVLRRLVCSNLDCVRQTFNEQVPGLAERYARRTPPLATLVAAAAVALAGRAGSALLAAAGVLLSRTTVLSTLMALPEPATRAPEAIGVDDFALKRNDRYATIIINAHTHERLDVLDGRLAVTLEAWLKAHPQVTVICRDRSTAYAAGAREVPRRWCRSLTGGTSGRTWPRRWRRFPSRIVPASATPIAVAPAARALPRSAPGPGTRRCTPCSPRAPHTDRSCVSCTCPATP